MSSRHGFLREAVFVENVNIPPHRARGLDDAAVARLVESMARLGLRTPISVRMDGDNLVLVAGRHRLEAARRLGWERIDAVHIDGDEADARLWEISENLHRAELLPVERAEHIAEWVKLTEEKVQTSQVATNETKRADGRGHRPEGGINAASRELGISKDAAHRATKIAALPGDIREQARAEGWSQKRLLEAASSKPVPPPPPIRNDAEAEDMWIAAIRRLWNKGAKEWRERFLEEVRA